MRKEMIVGPNGHGPTPGCKRCRAVFRNVASSTPHSADCRARFMEILHATPGAGAMKAVRVEERLTRETARAGEAMLDNADKKRKVDTEPASPVPLPHTSTVRSMPDVAMQLPTSSSSSSGAAPIQRKRQSETAVEEIDPNCINSDQAEVAVDLPPDSDAPMVDGTGANQAPEIANTSDVAPSGDTDMNALQSGAHPPKPGPDPYKERRQPLTK